MSTVGRQHTPTVTSLAGAEPAGGRRDESLTFFQRARGRAQGIRLLIRLPHLATFRDARVAEMRFRVRPVKRTRLPMAKSVLRQESVLAALPTELSHSLFAKARSVSLAADHTLFVVGDEADGCYRVEEGLLKASIAAPAGGERILAILGPGSVVGELSMIDRGPRSASVTALRDSKLSFVGRSAFEAFGQSRPELYRQVA